MADAIGKARQSVSLYATGQSAPDFVALVKIADYFGVTCDELLRGVKSENIGIHERLRLSDISIAAIERLATIYKRPDFLNKLFKHGFDRVIAEWDTAIEDYLEDKRMMDSTYHASDYSDGVYPLLDSKNNIVPGLYLKRINHEEYFDERLKSLNDMVVECIKSVAEEEAATNAETQE